MRTIVNNTESLELQLKSTGEKCLESFDKLLTSLTSLRKEVEKSTTAMSKMSKVNSDIKTLGNSSDKAATQVTRLSSALKGLTTYQLFKQIGLKAMDFLDNATNRAEELNLFNVIFKNIEKDGVKTFSDLGQEAFRFQNKLNEAFGTNMTETLRYQGLFQAMATNSGIKEKDAALMSETMTKLTYDLASLYNKSEKTVAEALRGGVYAGQTKPLRNFGIDVTQTSIKPILEQLGITDRSFNDLSQAEKQILRYVATLRQAQSAMGDFANTIESPANQLKIFKQQLVEVKTAWGNLFMGMYAEILPYVNAILMVLKEIAKAIANIFGLSTSDYNTGISSLEEMNEGFEDIGTGAGKATKAAKELKRQVLGFDQINNLTTPKKSGSSGGSGSGGAGLGGIDKRILDALSGYDNLMDKVKMKATEIRDRWMDILGFQKVLNPLTGEYEWKYQGIGTTIKNLWERFLDLNPQVRLFVGLLSLSAIGKMLSGISSLIKALGGTGLGQILKDDVTFFKQIKNTGVEAWTQNASGATRFKTALEGIGTAVAGWALVKTGMDDIIQTGGSLLSVLETLGGTVGTVFGGIQAGIAITGHAWGGAIGGIIGGFSSLITIIKGIAYANDEFQQKLDAATKEVTSDYDEWKKSIDSLNESYKIVDSEMSYYQKLYDELKTIVDENGKIKKGYEDRAAFITGELNKAFGTEIEIVGDTIKEYSKLKDEVQKAIDKEKARLKLVALEEKAKEAIKHEDEAKESLAKRTQELKEAEENYNKALTGPAKVDALGKLMQAKDNYNTAKKTLEGYTKTIRDWEKATELSVSGNTEQLNWYFDHEINLYGKSSSEQKKYWENYIKQNEDFLGVLEQTRNLYSEEEYKAQKKQYEDNIKLAKDEQEKLRLVMKTSSGTITDETIQAWKDMGNNSSAEFLKYFNQLPEDAKNKIVNYFKTNKSGISKEFQKAIDGLQKPKMTIDVKGNVSPITQSIRALVKKFAPFISDATVNSILAKFGLAASGGIFTAGSWKSIPQYANGGLPNHGTLFAAGENGAEIVGNINRRTEVLNRSQIASAIYTAVSDAMRNSGRSNVKVDFYAHTDEGVIVDRINQKTKQTGVCPINIPV